MDKKIEQQKVHILFCKVKACFSWFFIWAILNFSFLFRTADWWISMRIILNYFLWTLLWYLIWWYLTKTTNDYEAKETKKFFIWAKMFLNYSAFIIIFISTIFLSALHINYEQDKRYCKEEKTIENYLSCVNEAKNNILNISRIFHD